MLTLLLMGLALLVHLVLLVIWNMNLDYSLKEYKVTIVRGILDQLVILSKLTLGLSVSVHLLMVVLAVVAMA